MLPTITLNSTYFRETQKSEAPEQLYHYTNQGGLLGILKSGVFWATKIQYMNDATEFEYAVNLAKKELNKRISMINSTIKNHAIFNSFEKRACLLLQWIIDHLDAIAPANICAVSFCTNPDLLSQWRGYASVGMGYAVGFFSTELLEVAQNNTCRLGHCIYKEASQETILIELIDEALTKAKMCWDNSVENSHLAIGAGFERALVECGAFFKDPAFKEEDEWRLITSPKSYTDETFHFREGKSMLVPYCTLKIGNDSWQNRIAGITVGPCPHPQSARTAVDGLLMKVGGFPTPPVNVSKIPYRSW